MLTREEKRRAFADEVNAHGGKVAKRYGITRLGDLTRLDSVGIPVWTSARPKADTVTVQSGKSLDPAMARAGAIVEGIEYAAAEWPRGDFIVDVVGALTGPGIPLDLLSLCYGSLWNSQTPTAWETATHLNAGVAWMVPSDLIWMVQRVPKLFYDFQMTTNGLGSGCSPLDAAISGIYEVIERDAWTLFQYGSDKGLPFPPRVNLDALEGETREILDRIAQSGMRTYLFDTTTELGIPCFRAALYDLSLGNGGSYCGHGCHFDPFIAMNRALLEAAQSRACFTSGARDDLFRHGFLFLRQYDHSVDVRFLDTLPVEEGVKRFSVTFSNEQDELSSILKRLERHGFYDVLVKEIAREPIGNGTLHVVKAILPGLEGYYCETWTPGRRAIAYVKRLS